MRSIGLAPELAPLVTVTVAVAGPVPVAAWVPVPVAVCVPVVTSEFVTVVGTARVLEDGATELAVTAARLPSGVGQGPLYKLPCSPSAKV